MHDRFHDRPTLHHKSGRFAQRRDIGITEPTDNLRLHLRGATAAAHDLLDSSMRAASGWSSCEDYAQFLQLQFTARAPIEQWLEDHAPDDLKPPHQCPLIVQDLNNLGAHTPTTDGVFKPDLGLAESEPEAVLGMACLGMAWVLAGSALGNRSILKEVERAGNGAWPHAFLGDPAMLGFWSTLRRRIERPADFTEVETAARAATAVFDHFIAHAQPASQMPDQGNEAAVQ